MKNNKPIIIGSLITMLLLISAIAFGGATFSRVKTWSAGETLTASDLNAEFDNVLNNLDPDGIDDASTNATAMQATADPYPGSSASLATDLRGEIQRLRYQIAQITGETYWYVDPDVNIADSFDQALKTTSSPTFAGITVGNTGLHVLDSNASHDLILKPGSDLSADRNLTITTGDAAREITLSGDPTLNDWFDQSVKTSATPLFDYIKMNDSDDSNYLAISVQSDFSGNHNLKLYPGDAERNITLSGDPTLADWFDQSVKQAASPTFAGLTVGNFTVGSPLSVPPAAFVPAESSQDWYIRSNALRNASNVTYQLFFAPIFLPNGAVVSKLTLYGYRDDASATLSVSLIRDDRAGTSGTMATVSSDWTGGNSSGYDDSISNATINNSTYDYLLQLTIDPNDATSDVVFTGAKIDFS